MECYKWDGPFKIVATSPHGAIMLESDEGNIFKVLGTRQARIKRARHNRVYNLLAPMHALVFWSGLGGLVIQMGYRIHLNVRKRYFRNLDPHLK